MEKVSTFTHESHMGCFSVTSSIQDLESPEDGLGRVVFCRLVVVENPSGQESRPESRPFPGQGSRTV